MWWQRKKTIIVIISSLVSSYGSIAAACDVCTQTDEHLEAYFSIVEEILTLVEAQEEDDPQCYGRRTYQSTLDAISPSNTMVGSQTAAIQEIMLGSSVPIARDRHRFLDFDTRLVQAQQTMMTNNCLSYLSTLEFSMVQEIYDLLGDERLLVRMEIKNNHNRYDVINALGALHSYYTAFYINLVDNTPLTPFDPEDQLAKMQNAFPGLIRAWYTNSHRQNHTQINEAYLCVQGFQHACDSNLDTIVQDFDSILRTNMSDIRESMNSFQTSTERFFDEMRRLNGDSFATLTRERTNVLTQLYDEKTVDAFRGYRSIPLFASMGRFVDTLHTSRNEPYAAAPDVLFQDRVQQFGTTRSSLQEENRIVLYTDLVGAWTASVDAHEMRELTTESFDVIPITERMPQITAQMTLVEEKIGTPDKPNTIVRRLGGTCEMQCQNVSNKVCWYE